MLCSEGKKTLGRHARVETHFVASISVRTSLSRMVNLLLRSCFAGACTPR